jgi:hypothetical protein
MAGKREVDSKAKERKAQAQALRRRREILDALLKVLRGS